MRDFKFLSVTETAKVLGVTPETVRDWCSRFGFGIKPTPTAQWRIAESKLRQLRDRADDHLQDRASPTVDH
jgi:hypothetical protein